MKKLCLGLLCGLLLAGSSLASGLYYNAQNGDIITPGMITGPWGSAGEARMPNGTKALPGYSFSNETNSGFHLIETSHIGMSMYGTDTHEWFTTGEAMTGQIRIANGSAGLPSYAFTSGDGGLYKTDNHNGMAYGGAKISEWFATGEAITGALTTSLAMTAGTSLVVGTSISAGTTITATGGITGETIVATGKFGCNTKSPQAAYTVGAMPSLTSTAFGNNPSGFGSITEVTNLINLVTAIRAALVANGIAVQ